jgi:hypothetical protein
MPKPRRGESRNDYVSRAIPEIKQDSPGLSQKAIVGKAEGMYSSSSKKGGKSKGKGKGC